MRDLQGIAKANDDAVAREYNQAVRDGNLSLAARIASANPDLFPVVNLTREPRQRVQSEPESKAAAWLRMTAGRKVVARDDCEHKGAK